MIATPTLHRDWIHFEALRVVERLQGDGHQTYLVGGCVRDLLVGIHPKDFDIATSASPNQIRKRLPNSFLIGRRFKLILVKRGQLQFEVATFRKNFNAEEHGDHDETSGDNFFGTAEEDAKRRDFSINGIFYDPVKESLFDYVEGLEDIEARIVRMIGDPETRFREDPIRILRAIRLAHKINFSLEPQLRAAMIPTAELLAATPLPRRREEYLKILRLKDPWAALMELRDLDILPKILPGFASFLNQHEEAFFELVRTFPREKFNLEDPLQAFAVMVVPMAKILCDQGGGAETLAEESPLGLFLRHELGVFKAETNVLLQAIESFPIFEQVDTFRKRGLRRRRGFLLQEHTALAFQIAEWVDALDANTLLFWREEFTAANTPLPASPRSLQ